jgi:uncharacterized membrane protein YdjX (TVP38/TMEM64 family)
MPPEHKLSHPSHEIPPADPVRKSRARWIRWVIGLGVLMAAGVVIALFLEFGWWREIMDVMHAVDPVLALVLMALLPLFGFSIGVVYVVAGVKFGLVGGGVAIVGVTMVHLLGTHWIARSFLEKRLRRFLKKKHHHMPHAPDGAELSLAGMVALVPGPPYFLRNYTLALSGIPLRKYFWVCLLIYTIRSYVTLALGSLGSDPSRQGVYWLAAIIAVKLTICAFLIRRIARKHREMRAHEHRQPVAA